MGTSACNWDGVMYGGTTFSVYPTGNGIFNTGANGQGNYSSATADKLINETEYSAGTQPFYAYENYVAQQLPFIWMPNAYAVQAVSSKLANVAFNPLATLLPEYWYFTQ